MAGKEAGGGGLDGCSAEEGGRRSGEEEEAGQEGSESGHGRGRDCGDGGKERWGKEREGDREGEVKESALEQEGHGLLAQGDSELAHFLSFSRFSISPFSYSQFL